MNSRVIQDLKNAWRNTNSATAGFLQSVPAENIKTKPFENRFTEYTWEFACLIRTRLCYIDELKTGIQNFSSRPEIPEKETLMTLQKSELLDKLSQTSNAIIEQIEKISLALEKGEGQGEGASNKLGRIIWLLQHERLHQGKLLLYHAKSNYKIPASFKKTWGESNF